MKVCKNEDLIVVLIGMTMAKGVKKVTAIKIYELSYEIIGDKIDQVKLKYSQTLKEDMQNISTEFEFHYDEIKTQAEQLFLV